MVIALTWVLLGITTTGQAPADAPTDPSRSVGSAMSKGAFPWYDAPRDLVRPIETPVSRDRSASQTTTPRSESSTRLGSFGDILSYLGFAVALAVLVGLLVWFWKMYEPSADAEAITKQRKPGEAIAIEGLPAGLRRGFDLSDAWAEAIRRRDQGDLAGAIVCLFAHQLVTLSKLGLVRLAPGKTARQLLRSVTDPEARNRIMPTLRLFEAAYYGHQAPSVEEFNRVWLEAEAFEKRVASGAAS